MNDRVINYMLQERKMILRRMEKRVAVQELAETKPWTSRLPGLIKVTRMTRIRKTFWRRMRRMAWTSRTIKRTTRKDRGSKCTIGRMLRITIISWTVGHRPAYSHRLELVTSPWKPFRTRKWLSLNSRRRRWPVARTPRLLSKIWRCCKAPCTPCSINKCSSCS